MRCGDSVRPEPDFHLIRWGRLVQFMSWLLITMRVLRVFVRTSGIASEFVRIYIWY